MHIVGKEDGDSDGEAFKSLATSANSSNTYPMYGFGTSNAKCAISSDGTSPFQIQCNGAISTPSNSTIHLHPARLTPSVASPTGRGALRPVAITSASSPSACAIVSSSFSAQAATEANETYPEAALSVESAFEAGSILASNQGLQQWPGIHNVSCWGNDIQINNVPADPVNPELPIQAAGIACGLDHCCAVVHSNRSDVRCWGNHLGWNSSDSSNNTLVQSSDPSISIVSMCAANALTCTLDSVGAVRCAGENAPSLPVELIPRYFGAPVVQSMSLSCSDSLICIVAKDSNCPICFESGAAPAALTTVADLEAKYHCGLKSRTDNGIGVWVESISMSFHLSIEAIHAVGNHACI